jgi:hypothetical protein
MMHYGDGTPAKHGDLIISRSKYSKVETVGVLVSATAASTSCNGQMVALAQRPADDADLPGTAWVPVSSGNNLWSVTLSECFKAVALTTAEETVTT